MRVCVRVCLYRLIFLWENFTQLPFVKRNMTYGNMTGYERNEDDDDDDDDEFDEDDDDDDNKDDDEDDYEDEDTGYPVGKSGSCKSIIFTN